MSATSQAHPASAALAQAAGYLTVDTAIRERALAYPTRIALVEDQHRISYGELQSRVERLCHALLRLGVGRRDRIAVLSENRSEFVETILAAATLGAIVACQNWRQSDAEQGHCLRLVEPALVLASPRYVDRLAAIPHGARHPRPRRSGWCRRPSRHRPAAGWRLPKPAITQLRSSTITSWPYLPSGAQSESPCRRASKATAQ